MDINKLKDDFKNNPGLETITPLFRYLVDSTFYIPMYMVNKPISDEKIKNLKVGDTFISEEDLRFRADYLTTNGKDIYFPMFSSEDEAPEDYRKRFSMMPMNIYQCLEFADGKEGCVGMVLDAFTNNLIIKEKLLEMFRMFVEYVKEEERINKNQ